MKASGLTESHRTGRKAEQSEYSDESAHLSPTVSIPWYVQPKREHSRFEERRDGHGRARQLRNRYQRSGHAIVRITAPDAGFRL